MTNVKSYRDQDFRSFFDAYRKDHPDDVLTIADPVSDNQDVSAFIWKLSAQGRLPMLHFKQVDEIGVEVVANVFGSRERVARLLGATTADLHSAYQECSRRAVAPRDVSEGPVTGTVQERGIDLANLPMLRHFETDRAKYITSGIIVAENPDGGGGNLSYHRAMINSSESLATSLHSRGHLWRFLNTARERGENLKVAMVIGAHPLFMLAASARTAFGVDERDIAGGLLGSPLEVVRTPKYGIRVPAHAEYVLEGFLDHGAHVEEGPFGEFSGYSSDRSTNNLFHVETILQRNDPLLISVAGGRSDDHLNLARIPREAEMAEKLKQRFPSVTAVHYPASGTHFHAYVAVKQMRQGEARQVLLGLLGWDPILKTAVAVDADIDVARDSEVLWALATHFQPHRDIIVIDGLPGNALDPSSSPAGTTSRMGLDATRSEGFRGVVARIGDAAMEKASRMLAGAVGV
jgi:UbiD family decarboxylase